MSTIFSNTRPQIRADEARTLPQEFYTDPDHFRREMEAIHFATWLAPSTMPVVTVEPCFAQFAMAGYHTLSSAPTTRGLTGSMVRLRPRHTWRR